MCQINLNSFYSPRQMFTLASKEVCFSFPLKFTNITLYQLVLSGGSQGGRLLNIIENITKVSVKIIKYISYINILYIVISILLLYISCQGLHISGFWSLSKAAETR